MFRYVFLSFFIVVFRVTRVAAFFAFLAAGFLGETFFLATRFTSSHIFASELHRHPMARS